MHDPPGSGAGCRCTIHDLTLNTHEKVIDISMGDRLDDDDDGDDEFSKKDPPQYYQKHRQIEK